MESLSLILLLRTLHGLDDIILSHEQLMPGITFTNLLQKQNFFDNASGPINFLMHQLMTSSHACLLWLQKGDNNNINLLENTNNRSDLVW